MSEILRKLTSRKLWLSVAGVATGVFIALGGDASDVQTVAGAVTAVVSAVAYIFTEGKVDAAAVGQAVAAIEDAVEVIEEATDDGDGE